jgi:hypothetical protein
MPDEQTQKVLDDLATLRSRASGVHKQNEVSPLLSTLYLNEKLLFDDTMSDVSYNRKSLLRHQDAWESLRLSQAQMMAIAAHAINMNVVISAQSGDTANQSQVDPTRTGASDNLAAGIAPTNRVTDAAGSAIAAGVAESVQTNVTTQISALTQQMGILTTTVVGLAQSVNDGNAAIAGALATMIASLTALKPTGASS